MIGRKEKGRGKGRRDEKVKKKYKTEERFGQIGKDKKRERSWEKKETKKKIISKIKKK